MNARVLEAEQNSVSVTLGVAFQEQFRFSSIVSCLLQCFGPWKLVCGPVVPYGLCALEGVI